MRRMTWMVGALLIVAHLCGCNGNGASDTTPADVGDQADAPGQTDPDAGDPGEPDVADATGDDGEDDASQPGGDAGPDADADDGPVEEVDPYSAGEEGECATPPVTFEPSGTTSVSGSADGSCEQHRVSPFWIDRPVEIELRGSSELAEDGGSTRDAMIGVCLLRWEYVRVWNGPDQPSDFVADGWQRNELAYEGETPCGHFTPDGNGGFEPVDGATPFAGTTFKPGIYRLTVEFPELEEGDRHDYELDLESTDTGGPVCGNSEVESGSAWIEQCDDGGKDPFDACSAGCEWQRGTVVGGDETAEPNDTATEAFDLEGFHEVVWNDRLTPDGDDPADWFVLESPASAGFSIAPGDAGGAVVFSLHTSNADGEADEEVATEFTSRTFDDLGAGTYLLEVEADAAADEPGGAYGFEIQPE